MQPSQIGSYRISRTLGEGATGLVYAGQDAALQREVAIKVLKAGVGENVEQRFVREGRLLARLRHPGIVGVHGVGLHAGRPYLVMDLLVGSSLEARLEQDGAYTWGEAVELAGAVADALCYAHRMGVLHRDLKPENVVLDAEGRPILTDFGLGKALDGTTQVSVEGGLLGTPAYWAPEQARGDLGSIGPATDVYGVGGILYALLTGEGPNRGSSLAELVTSMQALPPPPSREAPSQLPAALDAICLRALARSPGDRHRSMEELRDALVELTQLRARGGRAPWVVAACATLVALGASGALALREPDQAVSQAPQASPTPSQSAPPVTPTPGRDLAATPTPTPAPAAMGEEEAKAAEVRLRNLIKQSQFAAAKDLAQELIRRAPERVYARVIMASILAEEGRAAEAFASYVAANQALPGRPELELGMIGAGIRLDEDYLPRLERLVKEKDPRLRASALLTRATLYHGRGDFYLAVNDYLAYLRIQPRDASIREKLALAMFDAREFSSLRGTLSGLRDSTRGGYLFVLGELQEAEQVLGKSREPEAYLLNAAAGARSLPSKVPPGLNRYTEAIYRYLCGRDSAEALVEAVAGDPVRVTQAHFFVAFDSLTRGELIVAERHFKAAQAGSQVPSLERSLSRWFSEMLRPKVSPFRGAETLPRKWRELLAMKQRQGTPPPATTAFESDLLLELFPADPVLSELNARNAWGPRAGIALSRYAKRAAQAGPAEKAAALQDLAFHQVGLRRWADGEKTFSRLLELQETPLARGVRGTSRLALRKIPGAIADLEAALAGSESLRPKIVSPLASAYLLARRDEDSLRTFAAVGPGANLEDVALTLLLAGWCLGREDVWRPQLGKLGRSPMRALWGYAMGALPRPRGADSWLAFLEGKQTWIEAGLPLRPPGSTSYRVVSGVYFASRGLDARAREQFEVALQNPYERAAVDTVIASRWLMDHPK